MNPTIPYLVHAARNAAKARDWFHLDLLLEELAAEVAHAPEPEKPKEWWRTFDYPSPHHNPANAWGTIRGDVHYR